MKEKMSISILEKNNELFANALTYKIVGKTNFINLLVSGDISRSYIDNYTSVIQKFLFDYENQIKIHLQKMKK